MSDPTKIDIGKIDIGQLLSSDENAAGFGEAIRAGSRKIFGHRPFNIDSVSYLATALECYYYARDHMRLANRYANRKELLGYAISRMAIEGSVLEFGVFSGSTINFIAENLPNQKIYGFDSFQGLPETWTAGTPAGHFKVETLPKVRDNVELIVGWFDRTLPNFLDRLPGNVALLHVDCDLYSSTQTIFNQLKDKIVAGTVIVFDEYFNYPDWRRHEFAAFQEFVAYNKIQYEYIGLVPSHEPVAVRILNVGRPTS